MCHRWQTLQSAWTRGKEKCGTSSKSSTCRSSTSYCDCELFLCWHKSFQHFIIKCIAADWLHFGSILSSSCCRTQQGHSKCSHFFDSVLHTLHKLLICQFVPRSMPPRIFFSLFTILFIKINIKQVGQLFLGNKESLPLDLTLSNKVSHVVRTYLCPGGQLWLAPGYQIV